ncbi:MAG TPA: LysR family transcriptional regulator [Stellaceae bacterium]|nr:LysR family transcriptional regulator [Stellaceae bacterium]
MDLNELRVFTKVAEAGSFTLAGKRLGMPKSTVSLQIARLEERLGVRLLQRTTRKLRLTEEGGAFYERCRRVMEDIDDAERSVMQEVERPRGHLRITAPVEFGTVFLGPWIAEYLSLYPDVSIELELTSRIVDIVEESYDLAIRTGHLATSSHIARKLGAVSRHLYASPAYIERRGMPPTPEALKEHACLGHRSQADGPSWIMTNGTLEFTIKVYCPLIANSFAMLCDAAAHGVGIAILPDYICREAVRGGQLARVLPDWSVPSADIFVVYPTRRLIAPRVRSFLDFTEKRLASAAQD